MARAACGLIVWWETKGEERGARPLEFVLARVACRRGLVLCEVLEPLQICKPLLEPSSNSALWPRVFSNGCCVFPHHLLPSSLSVSCIFCPLGSLTHSRVTRRVYDMVRPFSRVDGKYNSAIVHLLSSKQTLAVCSPTIPDEKKGKYQGHGKPKLRTNGQCIGPNNVSQENKNIESDRSMFEAWTSNLQVARY